MLPIYCEHFGLTREPFNITPDPNFLFMSASHREALAQLVYGIKARRGFVVLTGEVGTGKTTMIQCLLDELSSTTKTALIFSMVVSPKDLLRYVCEKFGLVSTQESSKEIHDYVSLLERFLLDSYRSRENVALIIDEAQNLPTEVLENVRLLSNFETAQDKLLQILLVGQPELGTRLNAAELRQIKQRVALRHHLSPLSLADCEKYIETRMKIAGGNISLFHPKSIEAVHKFSGGIPRLVNIICDNALLTTFALRKERVEGNMILEVARDLEINIFEHAANAVQDSPVLRRDSLSKKELTMTTSHGARLSAPGRIDEPLREPHMRDTQLNNTLAKSYDHWRKNKNTSNSQGSRDRISTNSNLASANMPSWFFAYMTEQLADAMGPMAVFVLRERIMAMGETVESFPKRRIVQLVEETSSEILDDRLKAGFKRTILNEIQAMYAAQSGHLNRDHQSH